MRTAYSILMQYPDGTETALQVLAPTENLAVEIARALGGDGIRVIRVVRVVQPTSESASSTDIIANMVGDEIREKDRTNARTSCPNPLGPMPEWVREVWKDPLTPQRRTTDQYQTIRPSP